METLNHTKDNPWCLRTAPGSSEYLAYVEERNTMTVLVCVVGKTVYEYNARCIEDFHRMLQASGDWMEWGGCDERKPPKPGTVEAWGRSSNNPNRGWYGLKMGLRGCFGAYVPPLMEALGLCELYHHPEGKWIRAIDLIGCSPWRPVLLQARA